MKQINNIMSDQDPYFYMHAENRIPQGEFLGYTQEYI